MKRVTMRLEPSDIRDYLEEAISYPVENDDVIDAIGEVVIEAPDHEESETIASLLTGVESNRYESADDLNQLLHSLLPDAYIGRKFYDDRSGERQEQSVREDDADTSF